MNLRDIFLTVLLTAIWGFNFIPVRYGLLHMPTLTFTALRFVVTIFPLIFFVKKPAVSWRKLAAFGLTMFAGQFWFTFYGIHAGMSAGLAALVMQTQAFFTIGLAALLFRDKPQWFQMLGALISAMGIAMVGLHVGGEVTIIGLCSEIMAALCWSCGNLILKSIGKVDLLGLIVWGNLFACVAMLPAAIGLDGIDVIQQALVNMDLRQIAAVLYISFIAAVAGHLIWSRMITRYHVAAVAPFGLLVPAFAMLSAAVFMGEEYPFWKLEASALILSGLAVNQFGGKIVSYLKKPRL